MPILFGFVYFYAKSLILTFFESIGLDVGLGQANRFAKSGPVDWPFKYGDSGTPQSCLLKCVWHPALRRWMLAHRQDAGRAAAVLRLMHWVRPDWALAFYVLTVDARGKC